MKLTDVKAVSVDHGPGPRPYSDGGYRDHRLWLSDGWQLVQAEHWTAPLYWRKQDGEHAIYDLAGVRPVDPSETACHLSLYEADAIAQVG